MNKWLKVTLIISVLLIVFLVLMFISTSRELKRIRNMPINNIDLATIKDGIYPGRFSYGGFTYEVKVILRNNTIIDIDVLKNRDTEYARKAAGIVTNVIRKQSLKVDTISGATTTSKALLKAIENALTGKPKGVK